jgi:hypothetical protein
LKLNHKFEIEVLCKNLNLNINDIAVKGVLRNFEVVEEQLTKYKDTPPSVKLTITAILTITTPPPVVTANKDSDNNKNNQSDNNSNNNQIQNNNSSSNTHSSSTFIAQPVAVP